MTELQGRKTVTVGIPAYNEGGNIGYVLKELLQQNQPDFVLEKIIVVSDGSTDQTDEIVRSKRDERVQLLKNSTRQGLAVVQNLICQTALSDILVILNADVLIRDKNFLTKLVAPILEGRADLTSGRMSALEASNFFEKILQTGAEYRLRVFESHRNGGNLYTCNGVMRAFSRHLYKSIRYERGYSEDMFTYLYCLKNGYRYAYVPAAVSYYKLPENLEDHRRQSLRFYIARRELQDFFDEALVNPETAIPKRLFVYQSLLHLLEQPLYFVSYFLLVVWLRLEAKFRKHNLTDLWPVAASTKVLRKPKKESYKKFSFVFIRRFAYVFLSLLHPWASRLKAPVIVVCYHAVGDDGWRFSIALEELKKQLLYLRKYYEPATMKDLEEHIRGTRLINRPSFVVTFDDGYQDVFQVKDLLEELGIKPSIFVLADLEHANREELQTDREFLRPGELQALSRAGWDIGCHSATHGNFQKLNQVELAQEVTAAKQKLQRDLGVEIRYFAYPKGIHNPAIRAVVREAGYALAVSMEDGFVGSDQDPLVLPRIGIDHSHKFWEFRQMFFLPAFHFRRFMRKLFFKHG